MIHLHDVMVMDVAPSCGSDQIFSGSPFLRSDATLREIASVRRSLLLAATFLQYTHPNHFLTNLISLVRVSETTR
jgi:hypothetical protein